MSEVELFLKKDLLQHEDEYENINLKYCFIIRSKFDN
jgi:hypothetical protein